MELYIAVHLLLSLNLTTIVDKNSSTFSSLCWINATQRGCSCHYDGNYNKLVISQQDGERGENTSSCPLWAQRINQIPHQTGRQNCGKWWGNAWLLLGYFKHCSLYRMKTKCTANLSRSNIGNTLEKLSLFRQNVIPERFALNGNSPLLSW